MPQINQIKQNGLNNQNKKILYIVQENKYSRTDPNNLFGRRSGRVGPVRVLVLVRVFRPIARRW